MMSGKILEATAVLCDERSRLHVDLYGVRGFIEREECVYCRGGESIKDIAIITRVGKPVCFKVMSIGHDEHGPYAILSRREAQKECAAYYLADLIPGDVIESRVTHLENFGAFVDIGCGISSLLSIDCISVSRISHPKSRLNVGMNIFTVVKSIDCESGRLFVSLKELLGTWEENASEFRVGSTVAGVIRSVENYGVFVELTPNLAGLAELRDSGGSSIITPESVGCRAAVYIKSIIPERMKIKLVLIDCSGEVVPAHPLKYYINTSRVRHIDRWRYSPACCDKLTESIFEVGR
jgi:small subunit ribosomal protein S1